MALLVSFTTLVRWRRGYLIHLLLVLLQSESTYSLGLDMEYES